MSESEPPQRNRSATIQIDAVDDLELLDSDSDEDHDDPTAPPAVSMPPPLPPRGSRAPSTMPPPARSPLVYVAIAVVGIAAGGLGIYLATTLFAEPEPEPEPTMMLEIGDIHISAEPDPSDSVE